MRLVLPLPQSNQIVTRAGLPLAAEAVEELQFHGRQQCQKLSLVYF
jgi:hypothetical protein